MAISKKKLSEVLQTAYSSIPLATSNNNGLLDKNIYSKACYMNQSPACIARVCDGGLVGILSIFKDHEDYHDISANTTGKGCSLVLLLLKPCLNNIKTSNKQCP